ncbi:MAG: DUF1045 domain-containing protein [Pseudomonadota bacterium]
MQAEEIGGYARYAIYWAPQPGSALAEAGIDWLGYDPMTGRGDPARASDPRVSTPRVYGLHATLKPPFRLAEGATPHALDAAVAALAARLAPAVAPDLAVDGDLGFLALRPSGPCPAIDALAARVVRDFDSFRAPLTDTERARRRADMLSPDARARLERWGYPHVLDAFRFHITLTGRLARDEAEATARALRIRFAPHLGGRFAVDALALFGDPGNGAGFRHLRHHPLTGSDAA